MQRARRSIISLVILLCCLDDTHATNPNQPTAPDVAMVTTPTGVSPKLLESRLRGALWGLFSGDALASPTHWYYGGLPQVRSDYGRSGITGYTKPVTVLQGSILNKSDPNGGGRLSYSGNSGKKVSIIGDVINHGKLKYWDPKSSIHYHATLAAGENTLEAQLVRVLMRSIAATEGRFDADHFRKAYVDFMMTPNSHNDTYASTCHRMFFANLVFRKLDPSKCPDNDSHNVDTVDGLILPTVTALAESVRLLTSNGVDSGGRAALRESAARTASVTRLSPVLEKMTGVWSELVLAALTTPSSNGDGAASGDMEPSLKDLAKRVGMRRPPRSDGRDEMSACYLDGSMPTVVDMLNKYTNQSSSLGGPGEACWSALISNANVGGENVHRGALLGAILGARAGEEDLPDRLKEGLSDRDAIGKEIDSFVEAVMKSASVATTTPTAEGKNGARSDL